jgi:anthranilate/para-aminobenzoate synthase component II
MPEHGRRPRQRRNAGVLHDVVSLVTTEQAVREAPQRGGIGQQGVGNGKARDVLHDRRGLFADLPSPLPCGRYHSLAVRQADLPAELAITARAPDGEIMALAHKKAPAWGVQFHPESILTPEGPRMIANFLFRAHP